MKKYIKFIMRNKEDNITLPFEQAEKVLNLPQQLVMIMDEGGNWTGDSINKTQVVTTYRDLERENIENPKIMIEEPEISPLSEEQMKKVEEEKEKIRRKFSVR